MNFYFKDSKWSAIPTSSAKWFELRGYGDCLKIEITTPAVQSFGWEEINGKYQKKDFTNAEFVDYLLEMKDLHELMLRRIRKVLQKVSK